MTLCWPVVSCTWATMCPGLLVAQRVSLQELVSEEVPATVRVPLVASKAQATSAAVVVRLTAVASEL